MEKLKYTLLLVIGLLVSTGMLASTDSHLKVMGSDDPYVYKVVYASETKQNINIKLRSSSGKVVLTKQVNNSDGFMLPLSFKGLKTDRYILELVSKEERLTSEIHYTSLIDKIKDGITIEYDVEKEKCVISSNAHYKGNWSIVVYNDDDANLISDKITSSTFENRIYDLFDSPGENIKVMVMFNDEVVTTQNFAK